MKWTAVTSLCITSGRWRIFRYNRATPECFELWCDGRYVGEYKTGDAAKAAAEEMSRKAA